MIMECRTWVSIANLPLDDESAWLPLISQLEREHPDLGPVASWDDPTTMVIVLSEHAPDKATAAQRAVMLVSEALHRCELSDRFASIFAVEIIRDPITA